MNSTLSVIVPTCDMAEHLPALARAITAGGLENLTTEVIFVDDGSTDDTPAVLTALAEDHPKFVVHRLPINQGRYAARLAGAHAARGTRLLFLDSRVIPPADFASSLEPRLEHGCAAVAVRIDVTKSVFNLYWERTHALIFRRNRRDEARGFHIDADNFADYVTGTTGFLCRRDDFLAACASFGERDLRSDDTFLMAEIARRRAIFVRDDWFVWWEPRQTTITFLRRLWDRGPGFAEYHLLERRGLYFYVLLAGYAYVAAAVGLLFTNPEVGAGLMLAGVGVITLTTLTFARGIKEFARLAPLHVATCAVAAAAALGGLVVCLCQPRTRRP